MRLLKAFLADASGATAVEYGIITALISVAILGSLNVLHNGIADTFNAVGNYMTLK